MTVKKKGGLYEYLDLTGVLNTGDDALIKAAKREYYKNYKSEWRKRQRTENREFTVILTSAETKEITDAANRHKRSPSQFIKESSLAYLRKQWVVPDVLAIHTVRQELAMNYNVLKKLFDENMVSYQTGTYLLQQMAALEQRVLAELYAKPLEQCIADALRKNPEYAETIRQLLQNL